MVRNTKLLEHKHPVVEKFPELNELWTIRTDQGEYLKGAGILSDGLVVPLFFTHEDAKQTLNELKQYEFDVFNWKLEKLENPITAMREAASCGAAGFQIQEVGSSEKFSQYALEKTFGRILFPFLVRIEELANKLPTVLGSGLLCDDGKYLTAFGEKNFDAHSLSQWLNWKLMDRASARLANKQPFRSIEPGEPFYCLSFQKTHVGIYGNFAQNGEGGVRLFETEAVVFFAKDNILRQYCSPEGYLPIFGCRQQAEEFLTTRAGGAFYIMMRSEYQGQPELVHHVGLKAQELLGPEKGLSAQIVEVQNLPKFLSDVQSTLKCPPWINFVINPTSHREDAAWGEFSGVTLKNITIKGVSGVWLIDESHQVKKLSEIDCFNAQDTFYFNGIGFDFTDLEVSYAPRIFQIDEHDVEHLSAVEINELIEQKLKNDVVEQQFDYGHSVDLDIEEFLALPIEEKQQLEKLFMDKMNSWVVRYWETVGGEKSEPEHFKSFIDLVSYITGLVKQDEKYRVEGAFSDSNIGFEGSKSYSLENDVTEKFFSQAKNFCLYAINDGYKPELAQALIILSNRVLKSIKLSICGFGSDLLVSHVENSSISDQDFYEEVGIPTFLAQRLRKRISSAPHLNSYEKLKKLVGSKNSQAYAPETVSFLTTAIFNFEQNGKNLNFDYAPVSVQIVKGLEFEFRRLFRNLFKGQDETIFNLEKTDDPRLMNFVKGDDTAVTLGFLIRELRRARNSEYNPHKFIKEKLMSIKAEVLFSKKTVLFIENDVLKKFRNGGAHDSFIGLDICELCIKTLIGDTNSRGLIASFAIAAKELET